MPTLRETPRGAAPSGAGNLGGNPGPTAGEQGSGTVLAVGLIGVLLALALALTGLVQAQSGASRARAGADLAAIAGATALTSVHAPGDPCAAASRVAGANGAALTACRLEGEDVVVGVSVTVTVLGLVRTATASARAGPA